MLSHIDQLIRNVENAIAAKRYNEMVAKSQAKLAETPAVPEYTKIYA